MKKPNRPVSVSYSPAGSIATPSQMDVRAVVVSDKDDNPIGVLEWWGTGCWIYTEVDSLRPVEGEQ